MKRCFEESPQPPLPLRLLIGHDTPRLTECPAKASQEVGTGNYSRGE